MACPPADERYMASTSSTVATPIAAGEPFAARPSTTSTRLSAGADLRVAVGGRGHGELRARAVGVAHHRTALVHVPQHVAALAEEPVLQELGLARADRAGRGDGADRTACEAHGDGVGEVDLELERRGHRGHALGHEAGQPEQQRRGVGHLRLPLPAAADGRVGVGAIARGVEGVAEHVAVGLRVAAVELAHDRGEEDGHVLDRADGAARAARRAAPAPAGCSATGSRRSARRRPARPGGRGRARRPGRSSAASRRARAPRDRARPPRPRGGRRAARPRSRRRRRPRRAGRRPTRRPGRAAERRRPPRRAASGSGSTTPAMVASGFADERRQVRPRRPPAAADDRDARAHASRKTRFALPEKSAACCASGSPEISSAYASSTSPYDE